MIQYYYVIIVGQVYQPTLLSDTKPAIAHEEGSSDVLSADASNCAGFAVISDDEIVRSLHESSPYSTSPRESHNK